MSPILFHVHIMWVGRDVPRILSTFDAIYYAVHLVESREIPEYTGTGSKA